VTPDASSLGRRLADLENLAGRPGRYVVAFSGGLDSTVLLHALKAAVDAGNDVPILAVHVDHGLHPDAADWTRHCRDVAREIGVAVRCLSVEVAMDTGLGIEAAARAARYHALEAEMQPGDWLLSAHHRDDQAETLLLNLVRGSGPVGIAGIGELRRFGPGWLVRPLLGFSRSSLESYARAAGLDWVEDPANRDLRFDRNFLRHEIVPALRARWPDIASRLDRSARHAGAAAELLGELAAIDLEALGGAPARLPIDGLLELSPERQRNVLRHALRRIGLPMPPEVKINRVLDEVIPAREDAQPLVSWRGAEVRRYRGALYLSAALSPELPESTTIGGEDVALGQGMGTLSFQHDADLGLAAALVGQGLRLEFRRGGEQFRPYGHAHTRKLKKLLQDEGIVPWMRDRLPLLYAGDRLVAVADLWLADDAVSRPGVAVRWHDRPALH
jgi:tRNA(Ile)-lysidine synthase